MKPALNGITILDISENIAGSYAALLLAEQGADCIKIERKISRSKHQSTEFALFNRSKRSLKLEWDTSGKAIFQQLVRKTDIVIGDLTPRQARKKDCNYEILSSLNNQLVYCAITPFGENGPLRNKVANDGVVAAFVGTMRSQGGLNWPPIFVNIPFSSYAAAMLGAYGVSLALFAREMTGNGQKVDTSLVAGAITMEAGAFIGGPNIIAVPVKYSVQQGVVPAYRLYECKDKKWIMIACGNPTFWNKLCMALDRIDLVADERFEGMPWALKSAEAREILTGILSEIFMRNDSAYSLKLLSDNDVPCAPVNTRSEFMIDPQVKHNGMIIEVNDYYLGKMKQMGVPIHLADYPSEVKSPAPHFGQQTNEILQQFGFDLRDIAGFQKAGII